MARSLSAAKKILFFLILAMLKTEKTVRKQLAKRPVLNGTTTVNAMQKLWHFKWTTLQKFAAKKKFSYDTVGTHAL